MASSQFPKSPNKVDANLPSAVGSRSSLVWEGRNKRTESKKMIEDTAKYITEYATQTMPEDVKKNVDIMANIEDKIYNYINQSYVNMFNRYTVTVEDEFIKKVRDFVDKEELKSLARYTPSEIVELLEKLGGSDKFNTGEIEKSIVNMYGHLQGHIQRGVNDLENETNAILRQKTDVGMFVRGENAYSIVKCAFKDNDLRPKTVTDVKLSINILDSELISPIFHYQTTVEYMLKDTLAKHVQSLITREVELLKEELVDQGQAELNESEQMFERVNRIEKYTDDGTSDPNSNRYKILAKKLMEKVEGLRAEIDQEEFDALGVRENIKSIIDSENIRNRGFNTIINTLTSILDTSKLGYQVCDNKKNARDIFIREYEDENKEALPDERYSIRLAFLQQNQLKILKKQYDEQVEAYQREVDYLWDVTHALYKKNKKRANIYDFDDLASDLMGRSWKDERRKTLDDPEAIQWNEVGFRRPSNSFVERNNRTYTVEFRNIEYRLTYLQNLLQEIFGYQNPKERVALDERINFMIRNFSRFSYEVNPHHIQPGVLLDVDVTTVKKKQYMLKQMANVLNEFLAGVSRGFADAAFASFKRRRSTVRDDSELSFSEEDIESEQTERMSHAYDSPSGSAGSSIGAAGAASAAADTAANKVEGSADVSPPDEGGDRLGDLGLKEL